MTSCFNDIIFYDLKNSLQKFSMKISENYTNMKLQIQKIPLAYQKFFLEVLSFLQGKDIEKEDYEDPLTYSFLIKFETFSKLCRPICENISWINQKSQNKVLYPVVSIVAFTNQDADYHSINKKLCLWVESGGTRAVPLRSNSLKQKIQKIMSNTLGFIVPQFKGKIQFDFFLDLVILLKKQKGYPILALGNSALVIIFLFYLSVESQIQNQAFRTDLVEKVKIFLQQNKQNILSETQIFPSYTSSLFSDLTLQTRLALENKQRISRTAYTLRSSNFYELKLQQELNIEGLMKEKMHWNCLSIKDKLYNQFYYFVDPSKYSNPDSIAFCHNSILNFIDQIRSSAKKMEQVIEVENYKLIICQEEGKSHFNIDLKLPKITK